MNQAQKDQQLEGTAFLSVGLPPKLRYLTMLRTRELDIAITRFISTAVDDSLKDASSGSYMNESLWHDDPAIRLYRLATSRADLLSHSEQMLWRGILKDKQVYAEDGTLCPNKISQQWQRLIVGF